MPLVLIAFSNLDPLIFAILLVILIITANYFEFIKATYLSCPGEGEALALRYTQKLLLDGRGLEAIKLLSLGALGATLVTAIITPLLLEIIPQVYKAIEDYLAMILIILSINMILKERENIGKAAIIFTLSGLLGMTVLRTEMLNQPLLSLLTGLYGISNMIRNIRIQEDIPTQMSKVVTEISRRTTLKGIIKAVMSSSLITFIPAIGPSQATAISNELAKTKNEKEKLITLGGVNTGDVMFSLTALFAINKARSGVIQQINLTGQNNYLILALTAIITAITCYWLINKTANKISRRISRINYTKLNIGLLMLVTIIVLLINGWQGLLVMLAAALLGLLAQDYKVNPNHLMAAVILPTIIYYI